MLALLSPAKSLDETSKLPTRKHTEPRLLEHSVELVEQLRQLSADELAELMHVSGEIAELNHQRFREFETPFTKANARPAVYLFSGDVYQGMRAAERFDERDLTELNKTVRILSGLYGLLRPLDLVQPYRLEMGTQFATDKGKNLYEYWGSTITDLVRDDLAASPGAEVLVNLASAEYFGAVDADALDARIISPRFEDRDAKGNWRVISFNAKRARGEMAGWLVTERVRSARALTAFEGAGYRYDKAASSPDVPLFRRER